MQRLPCEEGLCSKKKKEDSLAKMWCKGEMAGKEAGRDQIMDRLEARAKEARFQSQCNANSLKGLNGLNRSAGDFPGGPEVKTLHFQYRECRFDPWSGN